MSRTSVSALAQINTAAQRPEREREGEHGGGSRKEEEEGAVRAHLLSPLPTQLPLNTSVLRTHIHTYTHTECVAAVGVNTTRWHFSGTQRAWRNANKATRPWARRLS